VGVVYPGNPLEPGNEITGQDRVKIDCTEQVHFLKKQEKEEAKVIFKVEELTFLKDHPEAVLPKRPGSKWEGGSGQTADQGDIIAGGGKGGADPYHTLIIVEIIGDRTKDLFLHRANI